ncbi:sulfite exporter TauE/SafE family protein [Massilia sp. PAMC28688]|uniref:sulfite exporter TauE/SafE family protein n=1 Tax=Massilia sp. PAMC28688 TaxID=2861283 RepID=UPI001C6291E4|nr:sulfite exporter TauE/SafE family protein [Massilia sp. PAMC28688]QYF91872.1 sulfite exporter TauE/SafE family protein [Massilia sp. PAMC28688]
MDWTLVLILLLMGTGGGFAAGFLGVGGGMVLVPFVTMIFAARGFPPAIVVHMAIATSLATILFTSLSSVRAHHLHGAVRWPIVLLIAPGIVVGSWIGPYFAKQLDTSLLALVFGLFVAFSATQMILNRKPSPSRELPGPAGMFAAGATIGTVSGLVGAGGGFLSVPFMSWCNVKMHNAVATSAAIGFPIALSGTLSNIYHGWNEQGLPAHSLGYIYVPALLVIAAASVTMAPVGARAAHRMPVAKLKRIFAMVLYCLSAYMLWKAASSAGLLNA